MRSVIYTVRLVCRLLLGLTFTFSGFVKSVDPLGFAYKLQDYFSAFGVEWLSGGAVALALIAAAVELLLGVLLLLDEGRLVAVWGIAGFIFFFTPLTLYLALANPVSDCGCFGDAWKISNWGTFAKNVVLLVAVIVLLLGRWHRHTYRISEQRWRQYLLWVLLTGGAFAPGIYSLAHLPLIDFRPYHIGASIWDNMSIPEGAPQDEYSTLFLYEKNGVTQQFDESNYPWDDSTWRYVSSETRLLRKGYEPPIKHFTLHDKHGVDVVPSILQDSGRYLLVVWPFLDECEPEGMIRLQRLYAHAQRASLPIGIATSSSDELYGAIEKALPGAAIFQGDERVLKTIVRANPGVVLLHEGVVIGKWRAEDLPDEEYFSGNLLAKSLTGFYATTEWRWYWGIGLTLLLLSIYSGYTRRRDVMRGKEEKAPAIH